MECASEWRDPDRRPQHRAVVALQRGAFAALVLVTAVVTAQAGSLLEKLFTGKGTPGTEAPGSPGGAALATVRLTVEGMVCYG